MTIKNKIFTAGAAFFLIFVLLALMSIWTHREVSANLALRDKMDRELEEIQEFIGWKNNLIRSISDIVAQGRVPPLARAQFLLPDVQRIPSYDILAEAGLRLVDLIALKEQASKDMEQAFNTVRNQINELYYQLDERISTVLAVTQLDRVLGEDTSEKSALAPYVLKSLNQLTLVALNGLVSKRFSNKDKSVVMKNRRFISSQLHLIDPEGSVVKLFSKLYAQIEFLDGLIVESDMTFSAFERKIAQAKHDFNLAVKETEIDALVTKVKSDLNAANVKLANTSRFSLITVVLFLFLVPLLVISVGIFGLNTIVLNPIGHMMNAMKRIEDGKFDVVVPVGTRDEIGKLAWAFNTMAAEIKAKVAQMSRLNQDLRESESKYKTLVDYLPQRIFLKDRNSVYISCNRNFAADVRMAEEQIAGKTDFDLFPEEMAEKYRTDDARILLAGKPEEIEEPYVKEGERMIIQTVKTPVRNDKGEVFGVLGIFWDITQKKEMEAQMRLSQFIFDKAPIGIWRIGENAEVLDVNEQGCTSLGYSLEELCRMKIFDFDPSYSPQDWENGKIELKKVGTRFFETFHRRKNGEIFPIQVIQKEMWFKDQEFHVAFVQDISERKHDEEELHRLRNFLSNIINSMPSMLMAVDQDGRVTQWNNQAEQITGISFEKAYAKPLPEVLPRLAGEMKRIRTSIRERRVISSPKGSFQTDQETRFEDITIYPLVSNGVEGAVIRVDDVTEQVRLEEMMIQSEKMLSVGGLAAGMAHEINNPLAGMMQTADVMAGRLRNRLHIPANQKAAKAAGTTMAAIERFLEAREIPRMLDAIKDSGQRVAAIVDNMLSFARKSEAMVSSYSLEDLLEKTVELAATDYDLKKQYDFKHIEIQREYAPDLPGVPCEGAKIQQVLLNILRNGAQAMQTPGAEPPRFIFRTRLESERKMVVVEIEDNGTGMDEQTQKRVFEPFFTTKPVGVGTGLGLSVSYFIITENHQGEMEVESRPGAGAKFIIRLPVGGRK